MPPSKPSSLAPDPRLELAFLQPYVTPRVFDFLTANLGLMYVAISQFFFASMNVTVKYFLSVTRISVPTLIAVRMGVTSMGCVMGLYAMGDPNPILGPPGVRKWLLARGTTGWMSLSASYAAMRGLSASDSAAISFLSPTLTAITGFLFLGEKCTRRDIMAGGACLLGALVISQPPIIFGGDDGASATPGNTSSTAGDKISRVSGVFLAVTSVVFGSGAYIAIRKVGHQAHALHTVSYFANMCTIASVISIILTPGPAFWVNTPKQFVLIGLIGIFGFCAQMFITLGFQRERVGRVSVAMYLSISFTITLELLVFHTFPDPLSLLGIGVILSAAYWVAVSNAKAAKVSVGHDIEAQELDLAVLPETTPAPCRTTRHGREYEPVLKGEPDLRTKPKAKSNSLTVNGEVASRRNSTSSDHSGFASAGSASGR